VRVVTAVAAVTHLGGPETEALVNAIFDTVAAALVKGDTIELRGFGSFRVRQRRPYAARNPKSGAPVLVSATWAPYLRPSKPVQECLAAEEGTGQRPKLGEALRRSSQAGGSA